MRKSAKFHLPKSKCERVVAPKSDFSKEFGFRYIKRGSTIVMIGCPKGKSKAQARGCKVTRAGKRICGRKLICAVGTKAHAIITPAKKGVRCPTGGRRVARR
jgi:hypothetical protein